MVARDEERLSLDGHGVPTRVVGVLHLLVTERSLRITRPTSSSWIIDILNAYIDVLGTYLSLNTIKTLVGVEDSILYDAVLVPGHFLQRQDDRGGSVPKELDEEQDEQGVGLTISGKPQES